MYIALTEALVKDYGDFAVKLGESGALEGQLYADPKLDDFLLEEPRVGDRGA